ncbi:uncharacterized protein LOC134820482 isoform X2 [Bolinopsis microptera]|uniref:uncharacterized protein LOC134820482 isoform X2 n=1 Tax=Bolinopsis microptera TaxID=2820187 RepID=UPI003078E4DB
MVNKASTDLRQACQTALASTTMSESKIKIGLTRGLVDGGEIFAQFSLSSTAHYQHLFTYISAICSREKVLAIYWFNRHDREFVLIHDNTSMDLCLVQSGLHEILYIITESCSKLHGYNSKHKPEPIQLKTSSPSSGPSPDTANLERSSEEDQPSSTQQGEQHIPLRKMKKSASLEWSYEHPPSVQEVSSRDESAFDMTARGERPTYYPYLEHYQPSYPARPKPHRTPTRTKRAEPKLNKYHSQSDQSDEAANAKEVDQFVEQEPPKRKKKAKRRANRAALEQKRQEIEMESFKEFASTVTADYLAEMCRERTETERASKASNGRRLIWVTLWLASFVYAWYNIALSIGVFMSKPTATKLNFYEAVQRRCHFPDRDHL